MSRETNENGGTGIAVPRVKPMSYLRRPSYVPSSIPEEGTLLIPSNNDLRRSAPTVYQQQEPAINPLVPVNNNKHKHTKFKENGIEFHNVGIATPLLNGHADEMV